MRFLLTLILVFVSVGADAATYYVATTGNDSTGDGSIGNPWRTPAYGASQLTADGDILYIRAGTYDLTTPTVNRSCAIYPRANNCTIAAYSGESVTLRGSSGGTNYGISPTGGVIGAVGGYGGLVIDGFTILGMVVFDGNGYASQSVLRNCNVSIGGDGWSGTNQGGVLWFNDARNVLVQNNRFHDNVTGSESGTIQNNGLIMMYVAQDVTIELNDFYNSAGTGITMKDDIQDIIIRYNHIYDNASAGIWTGNNTADAYTLSASIYQNIIRNNNTSAGAEFGAITLVVETDQVNIYNNTFYQNYVADLLQWVVGGDVVPFAFFNNISSNPRSSHLSWPYASTVFTANYLNYNCYYNDVQWNYHGTIFETLSAWQTQAESLLAGAEANSVITNPVFMNASGAWNLPSDFKRTEYTTNGRGGSYSSVMGAYITGSETIGYTAGRGALTGVTISGATIH